MPSDPKATQQIDGLRLEWLPEHITCDINAIYQHHDGNVACELHIFTSQEGFGPHLLRHHINDLANAISRDRVANLLHKSYNHVPWDDIMEYICEYTIFQLRKTPVPISITDFTEAKPPEFCLFPFVLRRENNMLFGPGGGGKSLLALLWLILIESAMMENPFKWILHPKPLSILYLDWERSFNTHIYRIRGILWGLGQPAWGTGETQFNYQRLYLPLFQEIRNVQALITYHKADLIIIDSAGMAAGGDMNKTEPAIQFFGALGRLRTVSNETITSLILTHVAKNPETNRKTPYGNIYWRNECSSVWEIIPGEDKGHNINHLTLRNDKHNDYSWQPDIGLEIEWGEDGTRYKLCEPARRNEKRETWGMIWDALGSTSSIQEIAKSTGLDYGVVQNQLRVMEVEGYVDNPTYGKWAQGRRLG